MKQLAILLGICLLLGSCKQYPPLVENTSALQEAGMKPFYHGLASGDPLPDRVIIWTRVTPETQLPKIEVFWEVSEDPEFSESVQEGTFETGPERDYTVKVDVEGLEPGKDYYYHFFALNTISETGHTKTASTDAAALKMAVLISPPPIS